MPSLLAVGFSLFTGLTCDAPAVDDGRSFDSSCSVELLAGGSVRLPRLDRIRLEAEARFERRSFESSAFVTNTLVRTEFLELALLSDWPFLEGGRFRLSAVAGPELGLRLRARRRFGDVDQDVTDELLPADLKVVGGLRVSGRTGRGAIFVEGRFGFGLTNLDDTSQQSLHSRALSFLFGYSR